MVIKQHYHLATLIVLLGLPGTAMTADILDGLSLEFETGPLWFSRNDVRIPNEGGSRFDMRQLTGSGPALNTRLHALYQFNASHALKLTLAPVGSKGTGRLDAPVRFENSDFAADTATRGRYTFDTYRLTYRWLFHLGEQWDWGVGATLLVRDAEIALQQGSRSEVNDDLGLVPLLHVYGQYRWDERNSTILDIDAAAAPQGRAFDVTLKQQYDLPSGWFVSAGYRTLEGGADNDTVYTFAWLHYATLSVGYQF